jgi:phosphoglycolate phosphatase-like HAD superfamily hydrolase
MGYDTTMALYLFDLDNTLIDTGRVVNDGFKPALLEYLDLDLETFEGLNQVYWQQLTDSTDFDPRQYVQFLADQNQASSDKLLEIVYQPQWYTNHVFADVLSTLTELEKEHQLGIFSQGNHEYQTAKLRLAGLDKFFDQDCRFIFERKLAPQVLEKLPAATVIDDRIAVIETLSDYPQLKPLWLNRHQEKTDLNVNQIQTLSELLM